MISDDQDDCADLVVRQERDLGMETRQVAAVKSHEASAIGSGLAAHAVVRIEDFPVAKSFTERVGQADGGLHGGFEHLGRQHLFAVVFAVVHQSNEPVGKLTDIGNDGAGGSDTFGIFIVGNRVELEGVALFAVRDTVVGLLEQVRDGVGRGIHIEGLENVFADVLFPGLAGL